MSGKIELFRITDSHRQYEQFINLAINDYEELKNQIRNYFKQGMEEELKEYKVNILAERADSDEDYGIASNLVLGVLLPAVISFLTTYLTLSMGLSTEDKNFGALIAFFSFLVAVGFVFVMLYYLQRRRKNHKNKDNLNIKKALLYLESFEIGDALVEE
ncbi:TPA: hypothetical protein U2B44_001361 [Streptococcus suis]|nr:hypothetical protein [Streptococcus suis]